MNWIDLAQDREKLRALVNAVMDLRSSYNAGTLFTSSGTARFTRRILLRSFI